MDIVIDGAESYDGGVGTDLQRIRSYLLPFGVPVISAADGYLSRDPLHDQALVPSGE